MDLAKLAASLGLPKESSEAVVFDALTKRDGENRKAVESLAKLTGQLGEHGLSLGADGKLVRVEPLKLDIKEGDSDEVKALKAALAASNLEKQVVAAAGRKDFITKLCADLKLPPAEVALATEVLSVREELETVMLSKDGKGIELGKCKDFPSKVMKLMKSVVDLKGSVTKTPTAATDEKLAAEERAKIAAEILARTEGKKEEPVAAK